MTDTERVIELFELAGDHDSAGREAEAVGPYREALALGLPPDLDVRARIQLASTLRNLGEVGEAVAILRAVVDRHPERSRCRAMVR